MPKTSRAEPEEDTTPIEVILAQGLASGRLVDELNCYFNAGGIRTAQANMLARGEAADVAADAVALLHDVLADEMAYLIRAAEPKGAFGSLQALKAAMKAFDRIEKRIVKKIALSKKLDAQAAVIACAGVCCALFSVWEEPCNTFDLCGTDFAAGMDKVFARGPRLPNEVIGVLERFYERVKGEDSLGYLANAIAAAKAAAPPAGYVSAPAPAATAAAPAKKATRKVATPKAAGSSNTPRKAKAKAKA
jgi:hypothetical protein